MKGFSEQEKNHIRHLLLQKGTEMFSTYGLKKTSIKDLTDAAGIAQGSFYIFYASKEELYFDILESEEEKIKNRLLAEFNPEHIITPDDFAAFLVRQLDLTVNNAMIRRLYLENEFEALVRKLPKERLERHLQQDLDLLSPLIQKWQEKGLLTEQNQKVIGGVIRSFFLISLHKREIGDDIYHDTLKFLAQSIANSLFKGGIHRD